MGDSSQFWDEIESEHAGITRLLRNARLSLKPNTPSERAIDQMLESIIRGFESHFEHEERIMAVTKYPEARAHCAHHRVLLARLYSILHEVKAKQSVDAEQLSLVLETLYDDAIDHDLQLKLHLEGQVRA